jgi:hypothetical protein
LSEVGVVLAAQQAVPIAANNALDISKRVNNGPFGPNKDIDHIPAVYIKE